MLIEAKIIKHLNAEVGPTFAEVPKTNIPSKYSVISKTGGAFRNHAIRSAFITIQSIAPTMQEASELNEQVIISMLRLAEDNDVSRVQLNSDYNYTDSTKKNYRYQAVFDVVYFS